MPLIGILGFCFCVSIRFGHQLQFSIAPRSLVSGILELRKGWSPVGLGRVWTGQEVERCVTFGRIQSRKYRKASWLWGRAVPCFLLQEGRGKVKRDLGINCITISAFFRGLGIA